jgi:hypothetical protein
LILTGKLAEFMGIKGIVSPVVKQCGKVLSQLFGVLVQGDPDFEAVRPFRESELIRQALGLDTAVFAVESLRRRNPFFPILYGSPDSAPFPSPLSASSISGTHSPQPDT